jgi:hypothetical protein
MLVIITLFLRLFSHPDFPPGTGVDQHALKSWLILMNVVICSSHGVLVTSFVAKGVNG